MERCNEALAGAPFRRSPARAHDTTGVGGGGLADSLSPSAPLAPLSVAAAARPPASSSPQPSPLAATAVAPRPCHAPAGPNPLRPRAAPNRRLWRGALLVEPRCDGIPYTAT
ncbi:hypothetical protein ZWY2020_007627 [Hordeum vulgare]|nr:hypothetical protein ZWY2020_007627 [Hordeum vulgare]